MCRSTTGTWSEDDTLDYEILSWHKTFVNNLRRGILIAIIRGNEFQIILLLILLYHLYRPTTIYCGDYLQLLLIYFNILLMQEHRHTLITLFQILLQLVHHTSMRCAGQY